MRFNNLWISFTNLIGFFLILGDVGGVLGEILILSGMADKDGYDDDNGVDVMPLFFYFPN